ncbi:MAG: ABC transporter permease [Patescibacteria group bacterium]|nr:ABC transporter permease [Patescibacteria group bacterium]
MLTAFRQSIKSLITNPVRTVLTTLGIIIGIATVILVLSAGEGFRSLINDQVKTYGSNTLFAETRVPPTTKNRNASAASADLSRAASAVAITTLKNRDLDEIKRLPNVVGGYGMVVGQKVASYRDNAKSILFYGASADRFDIDKGTLKQGRFYTMAEEAGAAQVAILGSNLASDLFGQDDPEGKFFRLDDLNFQVIGVYNSRGGLGGGEDDSLYIPLNTAQKKILGINYVVALVIEMKDAKLGDATAEDVTMVLRRNHNITDPAKDDFVVQTMAQAMESFNTIFNGITLLLIAIAAISLVVGGVGIMNIMYVSVTERTSEIGLKKAVGAKPTDILNEFLIESVLVTLLGGVIGIALGSLLGALVAVIASANNLVWAFSVPLYAIALAFSVAAVLGIGFGVLPARAAAAMDPIEALRYE